MALFLGPATDVSTEVWEIIHVWDVQRRDDSTVIAVHPERDLWRTLRPDDYQTHISKLEMELPEFTRAVTTAHQARVTEYGGRIDADEDLPMLLTDANQLRQYFTAVGTYNDTDHPPAQPPPPCGIAVSDQATNPGLMRDCITLLAAKDTLRGSAALNWSVNTAITDWDGMTTGGTPSRVTRLLVDSKRPLREHTGGAWGPLRADPPQPEFELADGADSLGTWQASKSYRDQALGQLSHGLHTPGAKGRNDQRP